MNTGLCWNLAAEADTALQYLLYTRRQALSIVPCKTVQQLAIYITLQVLGIYYICFPLIIYQQMEQHSAVYCYKHCDVIFPLFLRTIYHRAAPHNVRFPSLGHKHSFVSTFCVFFHCARAGPEKRQAVPPREAWLWDHQFPIPFWSLSQSLSLSHQNDQISNRNRNVDPRLPQNDFHDKTSVLKRRPCGKRLVLGHCMLPFWWRNRVTNIQHI